MIRAVLLGERLMLAGTVLTGYTAALCPPGWRMLKRWKLTRLLISWGSLCNHHDAGPARSIPVQGNVR